MKNIGLLKGWGSQKPPVGTPLVPYGIGEGCVGAWLLGDGGGNTAFDSSLYHNNGTLTNGPAWVAGRNGTVLSFDGVNDYVSVPNLNLAFGAGRIISVSMWVRSDAVDSSLNAVFRHGNLSIYQWSDNQWRLNAAIDTNVDVVQGQWTHLVLFQDDFGVADNVKFWVNGTLRYDSTGHVALSTAELRIGNDAFSQPWQGLIDDVRIYNRALSAGEVARLYMEPYAGYAVPRRRVFQSAVAAGGGFKPPRQSLWIPGRGTIIQSSYNQCQI